MGLVDTTTSRASACPVHFVWDGRGPGRPLVRIGFMGLLIAGAAWSMGAMVHAPALKSLAVVVAIGSAVGWGVGQLLGRVPRR